MIALGLFQVHYQILNDNLSEGLYSDKYIDCKSCLDYMKFKDDQLIFKCFECKKNCKKDFNKELIIYEFCHNSEVLMHAKRVFKKLNHKNLGDYHDLYVQSDTLLLAGLFLFRNKCIETYKLDPGHFLSAPGLAWQPCLKKTVIKLEFFTKNDVLLIVDKRNRGGICHAIHQYAKANNK